MKMENILAIITEWDDAKAVLSRAGRLAEQFNTRLEVLRPVHSPLAEIDKYVGYGEVTNLRDSIMDAERRRVRELCADQDGPSEIVSHVEWCERVHETIIEKAESYGAGLIVMMASHDSVLSKLIHTPDDWHLFRNTPCPVLSLVRDEKSISRVIAAIDALDLSEAHKVLSSRVLDQARAMATAEDVPLTVLSVVPDPALLYAGLVNAPMGGDFQVAAIAKAEQNIEDLLAHLGVVVDAVEVKAGRIEDVATREGQAGGLLVIGTAANKGVKGFWIGNTAERILHRMQSDMLVVN
jgi:nucleotide-binding universal stress UspA family protein